MLAMAGVNAGLAAAGRSALYVEFVENSFIDVYRTFWESVVGPHPLPWVLALVAFEAWLGIATLRGGRARLVALGASAAFIVALTPADPTTLGNPVLAALPAYLAVRHLRDRREVEEERGGG